MRSMMLVKSREGVPPTPELLAAIGGLAQEMFAKGALVEMGGLAPSSAGARIRLSRGLDPTPRRTAIVVCAAPEHVHPA